MSPLQMLRHHVTGAIDRGESVAIIEQPSASAQAEARANADAHLQNAGLPTYSELRAAASTLLAAMDGATDAFVVERAAIAVLLNGEG